MRTLNSGYRVLITPRTARERHRCQTTRRLMSGTDRCRAAGQEQSSLAAKNRGRGSLHMCAVHNPISAEKQVAARPDPEHILTARAGVSVGCGGAALSPFEADWAHFFIRTMRCRLAVTSAVDSFGFLLLVETDRVCQLIKSVSKWPPIHDYTIVARGFVRWTHYSWTIISQLLDLYI